MFSIRSLTVQFVRHFFYDGISFRVDGRIVEWILCMGNTKEPGGLFERFGSHAGYFEQVGSSGEVSVLFAIIDYVLSELRT